MLGSLGYYTAYAVIIYRTVYGELSLGDLTFLSGSFLRLRSLMEAILIRFSSIADSALYLRDLFDFLEMEPSKMTIGCFVTNKSFIIRNLIYRGADLRK